jgi:hypothetical protein
MTHAESANGQPAAVARRAVSVRELEQSLPSPAEVAEQAAQLRAASVAAISVGDVNEMMAAILAKAKAGDAKCVRLVLDHLNSHKPTREPGRPAQTPAPIRLEPVEPDPPKCVAIESFATEQHRKLIALHLLAHQPASVHGVGQLTGLAGDELTAVLNHEWFQEQNGLVRLTSKGRNYVG